LIKGFYTDDNQFYINGKNISSRHNLTAAKCVYLQVVGGITGTPKNKRSIIWVSPH